MVGNLSNYHKLDVVRMLFSLTEIKSRSQLVESLEIGEGTIRTLLTMLKDKKLIESTSGGHILSKKGFSVLFSLQKMFLTPKKVKLDAFYPDMVKVAVLVKNVGEVSYVTLRDVAVKNGTEGALIFRYDKGLELPGHKGNFPSLEEEFDFSEGDLLIVSFSSSLRWAEIGSLAVVEKIVPQLMSFVSDF